MLIFMVGIVFHGSPSVVLEGLPDSIFRPKTHLFEGQKVKPSTFTGKSWKLCRQKNPSESVMRFPCEDGYFKAQRCMFSRPTFKR